MNVQSCFRQLRQAANVHMPNRNTANRFPEKQMSSENAKDACRKRKARPELTGSSRSREYSAASFVTACELSTRFAMEFLMLLAEKPRNMSVPGFDRLYVISFFISIRFYCCLRCKGTEMQ